MCQRPIQALHILEIAKMKAWDSERGIIRIAWLEKVMCIHWDQGPEGSSVSKVIWLCFVTPQITARDTLQ
jgi:hypothetical protein